MQEDGHIFPFLDPQTNECIGQFVNSFIRLLIGELIISIGDCQPFGVGSCALRKKCSDIHGISLPHLHGAGKIESNLRKEVDQNKSEQNQNTKGEGRPHNIGERPASGDGLNGEKI